MKILPLVCIILALISLISGGVLRIIDITFPSGNIPPQTFLEFTIACLLFSIALSNSETGIVIDFTIPWMSVK